MGHSWATLFALKGYRVLLQDIDAEKLRQAQDWIKTALELYVEKGVMGEGEIDSAIERLSNTTELDEAVSGADFVLESVYEDYGVKKEVFKKIGDSAPEHAIIASGSSKLLISEIQKAANGPERCVGVHGFNPPHLIPLVEIVPGDLTSSMTVDRTVTLMKDIGKVPIVVKKEVSAYLSNRIQYSVIKEARDIVESGIASVEEVDLAMSTGLGLRWALYGPFLVAYFNTPSHLTKNYNLSGLVAEGLEDYSLLKDKSFDDMVRWRNSKLLDVLRVLELLPSF
jgi:3-hydroxyacyl-CoA dehydrogenase